MPKTGQVGGNMKRVLGRLALIVMGLLVLVGCATSSTPETTAQVEPDDPSVSSTPSTEDSTPDASAPVVGTNIVIALPAEPSSMDAQLVDDGAMDHVILNVLEGLTTRGQDMSIEPQLAESWEQVDEVTWEFKLRQDVLFHNGELLTADDVAFSINRIVDPENESAIVSYMSNVMEANVVDDTTVSVTTNGPEPNLPAALAFGLVAPREVVESDPEGFARQPIGTGPYVFDEWAPGEHIRLSLFNDHWSMDRPSITDVEYVWRDEPSVRFAALEAGEVDIAVSLSPEQAERAPKVSSAPALEVTELAFDTLSGPLQDLRLREAINLAIDRESLLSEIFLGFANPASGQITIPSTLGFHPDLTDYPYDPERARALVEEAGAVGTPVVFVAQRGRWVKDGEATEAIAEMIRQTGLDVQLEFLEWSQYLERIFDPASTVDITYFAGSNDTFDSSRILNTLILCEATLSRYCNEEVDALAQEASQAETIEEKSEIYQRIWELVYEDHAVAPLANIELLYGLQPDIEFQARSDGRIKVAEVSAS